MHTAGAATAQLGRDRNQCTVTGIQQMSGLEKRIWKAVDTGNKQEVLRLVNGAMDPTAFRYQDKDSKGWTTSALMIASYRGDTETVNMLVKAGADVDLQSLDYYGWTALMYASEHGHTATVQALLKLGAKVNLQAKDGFTALMRATKSGHVETAQALLACGADKNLRNKDGKTAVDVAASEAIKKMMNNHLAEECAVLQVECDTICKQVAQALPRKDAIMQKDVLQAQLRSALSAGGKLDMQVISRLCDSLEVLKQDSAKLPLSEEDYLTLSARHATLIKKAKAKCDALLKAEEPALLVSLASKLATLEGLPTEALQLSNHSGKPITVMSVKPHDPAKLQRLQTECTSLTQHLAPQSNAAKSGSTSEYVMAAKKLLEQQVQGMCEDLVVARQYRLLRDLADKLAALRALDKSTEAASSKDGQSETITGGSSNSTVTHSNSTPVLTTSLPAISVANQKRENSPGGLSPRARDVILLPALSPRSDNVGHSGRTSAALATDKTPSSTSPAVIAEQDRQALAVFLQTAPRLEQALLTVAAHDRALQVLVSKEKECPSLFWFYPKKPELRRWLSDPAKCLFQDSLMMVVVCPVTLCVVPCGPDGVGWEVNMPKKWVKEWGPAILFSIYVLQAAVVAGRVVGIPIPPAPGASEVKEALGLKGMLGTAFQKGGDQVSLSDSLNAFSDTTKNALDLNPELQALCEGLRAPRAAAADQALPTHLPMRLVGDAYKSIHTFLTTGENAMLGKLEDQLRGRMERVMAPDGDIEWVSVEGKSAWLQKHSAVVSSMLAQQQPALDRRAVAAFSIISGNVGTPSQPANVTPATSTTRSWLAVRLMERGVVSGEVLARLDAVLVSDEGEGFTTEESFAKLPLCEMHHDYLRSLGITAKGTATHLIELHAQLCVKFSKQPTAVHSKSPINESDAGASKEAMLTMEEKGALLKRLDSLTHHMHKLQESSNNAVKGTSATAGTSAQQRGGELGGRGGLIQKQMQESEIRNPRTNQPYTMDELAAEIQRLQQDVAAVDGKVVGVAAAAEERLGELEQQQAQSNPQSGKEEGRKKPLSSWFKPW